MCRDNLSNNSHMQSVDQPAASAGKAGTVDQAAAIGNDTEYGLAAYISGNDTAEVRALASKLRAGQVILNYAQGDMMAPFGGYKQSGNGREWGDAAFAEFLETKAIIGYAAAAAAE